MAAAFTGTMPPRASGARAMAELLGAAGEAAAAAMATTTRAVAVVAGDAAAATAYPPMGTPMEVSFKAHENVFFRSSPLRCTFSLCTSNAQQ